MKYVVKEFAAMMGEAVEVRRSQLFASRSEAEDYDYKYGRNDRCGYSVISEVNDDGTEIENEEDDW